MAKRTPADIARDTLRLLVSRRLPPTPSNYQSVYEEVAGLLPQEPFPQTSLRHITHMLPTQTPVQKRIAREFHNAVEAQNWIALQSAIIDYAQLDLGLAPQNNEPCFDAKPSTVAVLPESLALHLARLIEATMSALGEEDQRMHDLSDQLVHFLRTTAPPLTALEPMLHNYSYRLSFTSEDQAQRRRSIHALLHMVGKHIAAIAAHDALLQQQAQALETAMNQPWTLQQLDTIQIHLKNLLSRHLEIEDSRTNAHEQMKTLLAAHTTQLHSLGKLSEHHASALTACAEQIQASKDLGDLADVLASVVASGSALATESRFVQAQLEDLRTQNQVQEQEIEKLSTTLSLVQDSTRHDPVISALNYQGLQEALLTEGARRQRHTQPISVATIQIDRLTELQETYGVDAACAAVVHLARLVRSTLRPQDALARLSEQTLALLFPNTDATQAAHALARLQTELTQRPLCFDEQRIPLTFSAGVIAVSPLDTPAESISRASQACDQAQHMGMGRVALG